MRIVITGAGGNLGQKLIAHLNSLDWCEAIVGIDVRPFPEFGKARFVEADLADAGDARWQEEVTRADAVAHFAAENPFPDALWIEAAHSFDMTANLLQHAGRERECRFVFASTNHVMGGYKDAPIPGEGRIGPDTPPLPGTRFHDGRRYNTAFAYASAKLMGERALLARAAASGGRVTGVVTRIGWCQSGENSAATLSASGTPKIEGALARDRDEEERDLRWFRAMWLSNSDFVAGYERALFADAKRWPGSAVIVNLMSDNRGMPWDLDPGRRWIGYEPKDDVWAELERLGRM